MPDLPRRTAGRAGMFVASSTLWLALAACHAPAERTCLPFAFSTKRFDVHSQEDSPGLRELARQAEDCLEVIEEVLGPMPAGVRPILLPFPEGCGLRDHAGSGENALHGLFEPGRPPRMFFTWGGCPVGVREILVHEMFHWYATETAPKATQWLVEAASEWLERELVAFEGDETKGHEAHRLAALDESRRLAPSGKRPQEAQANAWFVAYVLCERGSVDDGTLGERLGGFLRMSDENVQALYGEYQKALTGDLWKGGPPRRFIR